MGPYDSTGSGLPACCAYSSSMARPPFCRQSPEVGAECVNCARSDLCGVCRVTGIPTAIQLTSTHGPLNARWAWIENCLFLGNPRYYSGITTTSSPEYKSLISTASVAQTKTTTNATQIAVCVRLPSDFSAEDCGKPDGTIDSCTCHLRWCVLLGCNNLMPR